MACLLDCFLWMFPCLRKKTPEEIENVNQLKVLRKEKNRLKRERKKQKKIEKKMKKQKKTQKSLASSTPEVMSSEPNDPKVELLRKTEPPELRTSTQSETLKIPEKVSPPIDAVKESTTPSAEFFNIDKSELLRKIEPDERAPSTKSENVANPEKLISDTDDLKPVIIPSPELTKTGSDHDQDERLRTNEAPEPSTSGKNNVISPVPEIVTSAMNDMASDSELMTSNTSINLFETTELTLTARKTEDHVSDHVPVSPELVNSSSDHEVLTYELSSNSDDTLDILSIESISDNDASVYDQTQTVAQYGGSEEIVVMPSANPPSTSSGARNHVAPEPRPLNDPDPDPEEFEDGEYPREGNGWITVELTDHQAVTNQFLMRLNGIRNYNSTTTTIYIEKPPKWVYAQVPTVESRDDDKVLFGHYIFNKWADRKCPIKLYRFIEMKKDLHLKDMESSTPDPQINPLRKKYPKFLNPESRKYY